MSEYTSTHRSQFLPTSLRATIIAASYWVLSLSLADLSGSVASFIGCLCGCYLVDLYLERLPLRNLRTPVLLLGNALLAMLGVLLGTLITGSHWLAETAGALNAYHAAEFLQWLLVCSALTMTLRILAHRSSFGAVLEIAFVAAAFIITLSAHRNGMIHRPYFIGDYALMRGIDPASILLAMGCGAVLCLSALLMMEQNQKRLPYHFAVLGLLCFSLIGYVQLFGLPTPSYTDELGLTGQEQSRAESDNPFKDGENNADNLQAPVAIVLFRDDYEPVNGSYYFRETAYSQWNGNLLVEPARLDMDQDLMDHFPLTREDMPDALPNLGQRSQVRTSIGLLTPHRTPFGLDTPVSYEITPNPNSLRFKRTYDVMSQAPEFTYDDLLGREVGAPEWSDEVWKEYTTGPSDPRYAELANQLIQNLRPQYANDPFAKAWAVKSYLDENGIYSLKNEHAYASDPAGSFLFGDLTGYCMHFAFAATYLYRSLGIPARVGIGYSVPASNRAGGSALLVQAIHGHAWPEVYFRDLGWVIIDPAPQQTLVDMTTDPQNGLQQLLGDMLRDDASFEQFMEDQQSGLIPIRTLLTAFAALLLAALLSGYGVKIWRLYLPIAGQPLDRYRTSYRAALDRLAAVGLHRRHGESREAFARRVAAVSPAFNSMTAQHLRVALGDGPAVGDHFNWLGQSRQVDDELRQHIPLWKRCLGLLNPFNWIMSK